MNANEFAEVFPVGEYLSDELEARGWTQADFAEILGRPAQLVSEIIAGKKEITRESAAQIGEALGTSAQYWLSLQDIYFLWHQRRDPRAQSDLEEVRRRARLRERAPISILMKRGFLHSEEVSDQERELMELYEALDLDDTKAFTLAARRSNRDEDLTPVQLGWIMSVRKVAASRLPAKPFSEEGLRTLALSLSRDLRDPAALSGLPERFAQVGVRLVFVESFPGSKLDGCSLMLGDVPTIGLSGRGQRLDKVLFTLLHEIAHILLGHLAAHGLIVDELDGTTAVGDEAEADQQAAAWVLAEPLPNRIPQRVSMEWVAEAASRRGVHPIVIVGRLQNLGKVGWKTTLVKGAPNATEHLRRWR